jgi:hypothetical protein
MNEPRSERVIEGEARPMWGRLPVAAVVVVSVLLAAIVGMTSADSPWVPGDGSQSSPPAIVGQVLAVALAAGLCVLLGLIWIHTPRRSKARKKPGGPVFAADEVGAGLRAGSVVLVGGVLVVVALVIAFWLLFEQADLALPPPSSGVTTTGDAGVLPPPEPPSSAPPAFGWFLFGLVASSAVVLPVALLARRRLWVTDPEQEASDVPESVVRAVGDSIDQIERDPDARRAIIRAYAQMEHAFDDAGIPRRPHEAPFEYLGRALRSLRVSPPAAGRLAALFERARFSKHVVGAETKHEAIGALREIERQMQAPSA